MPKIGKIVVHNKYFRQKQLIISIIKKLIIKLKKIQLKMKIRN